MERTEYGDAELEAAAYRAAELFVQVFRGWESRRVAPAATEAEVRALFRGTLGERGTGMLRAVEDFAGKVLPHSLAIPSPMYAGLVNSSPLAGAALADGLVSALNNNAGAFHQGPAVSACEEEVLRAFARLAGMPEDTEGMLLPGGTFANLQGLVLARDAAFPDVLPPEARLYTSEASHFSVARAARIAGLGPRAIVALPTTGRGALDVHALRTRVREDRAAGARPFAVVATLGTTGTGAIDPIAEVAALCREERLWLHVDACYGGAALLVPELAGRLRDAVARADSLAVDAHKWFFIPLTAGLLLTPHRETARAMFDVAASFIPDGDRVDAWRRGMPTSRRATGLTVWMGLRAHGWGAVREAVERNIRLTRELEAGLARRGFEVLGGGELSIACARRVPPGWAEEAVDRLQESLAREVTASGASWFTTVRLHGRVWLRFNLVNLYVQAHHVARLVDLVAERAREVERAGVS
ncbi:MAG TPA: pyridoxal-dependent decarboxylase [Myxococcus sp.]|nr:pyridoxal-dependent decarboxylase [Myxococcus sp.]